MFAARAWEIRLKLLHHLDIRDKHRGLLLAASGVMAAEATFGTERAVEDISFGAVGHVVLVADEWVTFLEVHEVTQQELVPRSVRSDSAAAGTTAPSQI